jgi:hypothetical protein
MDALGAVFRDAIAMQSKAGDAVTTDWCVVVAAVVGVVDSGRPYGVSLPMCALVCRSLTLEAFETSLLLLSALMLSMARHDAPATVTATAAVTAAPSSSPSASDAAASLSDGSLSAAVREVVLRHLVPALEDKGARLQIKAHWLAQRRALTNTVTGTSSAPHGSQISALFSALLVRPSASVCDCDCDRGRCL